MWMASLAPARNCSPSTLICVVCAPSCQPCPREACSRHARAQARLSFASATSPVAVHGGRRLRGANIPSRGIPPRSCQLWPSQSLQRWASVRGKRSRSDSGEEDRLEARPTGVFHFARISISFVPPAAGNQTHTRFHQADVGFPRPLESLPRAGSLRSHRRVPVPAAPPPPA